MLTVLLVLAIAAFGTVIASAATGKVPLWVPVMMLSVFALLQVLPLGR